ncbi:MAG TPA: hypothetical protein VE954_17575 [Oligoflexus sp.]|uniref:hypothetical protein n=1 Tax=Oligoflexus sp. TaxID=1971216 RepID=UPI002D43CD79|nr:hypothetical protein [Oligoflexus sp.]HYX34910.1 hypothetical protein [Oligoflexus sp.]
MLKGARMPLKRHPLELRKAMDVLQHEIVNLGVTLVIPRNMRLRMRGDDPENFAVHSMEENGDDSRVAANMVNCREWVYLDRLL